MELTPDIMYKAALEKDTTFEGVFFTAVKTTGIFCRPICTARKPKKENVEFFRTSKEAILKGYRPCKVCRPLEKLNETPVYVKQILAEIDKDPSKKIKDYDLEKRGIEPNAIRRWFLKNHGITFHSYQRMLRLNTAFKKIQEGDKITPTAFDIGYGSLSGFNETFRAVFGVSPKQSISKRVIDIKRIETPLGTMFACATNEGVCLLEFTDRKMLETELKDLTRRLDAVIVQGENAYFKMLELQLAEYFEGRRKTFTLPLFTPGTDFQQMVWQGLSQIPYGEVRSYKQQAFLLDRPEAIRAVANANGLNRISILIPCHRVIGSEGQLTGYGGGIWRKKELLQLEGVKV